MTIDVYSSTGSKKGTLTLPDALFNAPMNMDLMHQAVVMQQSNRRHPIAHVKSRGEVHGSAKKMFQQKGTGRARRGNIRSPILRGGGKAFGPRNFANFRKDMPKNMRHAAIRSSLTLQAKRSAIVALDSYPETIKTKTFSALLKKLPVEMGRRLLFVVPAQHHALWMSSRNIPRVKILVAQYLNPEDVLNSKSIIFVGDAVEKAEKIFGGAQREQKAPKAPKKRMATNKSSTKSSPTSA